jgi:glycosyltransferase involved in cell wall biosynthesis
MTGSGDPANTLDDLEPAAPDALRVIIATNFREVGQTGIHTHIAQWRGYLEHQGSTVNLVTPFSWSKVLASLVFAPRLALKHINKAASLWWYRHWHQIFLRKGLHRRLARLDDCVIYAQGPLEANAALQARRGKHQRVIMAVHFRTSQADEHAEPGREIKPNGALFRSIRRFEREVIPQLDGIMYVSNWARDALLSWLPEAAMVPSTVIGNAVAPVSAERRIPPLADLVSVGRLDEPKNHRFILDVLAEARKAGRLLTLDIYGDGLLRGTLKRQAEMLGVAGQVALHGFRSDVRTFLPSYRVYVHASYLETSSLAIIEAMAAGLPIVAGGIDPITELCGDGVEVRFWPLDDPAEAAASLLELLDSEAALESASKAALKRFEQDFDVNVVGARMRSFLLHAGTAVPPCD